MRLVSKYTTEVRFICESEAGYSENQGASNINAVIEKSWNKIFGDFPIYDESYRKVLCCKILKHFYLREIASETVGIWKMWLTERMNMIMPYYNQLYKSATLEFNPLYDVDLNTTHNLKDEGNNSSTLHGEDNNTRTDNLSSLRTDNLKHSDENNQWNKFSDTPQGALTGVETGEYLTDARNVTDKGSSTDTGTQKLDNTGTHVNAATSDSESTGNYSSLKEYSEHVQGKRSGTSYSKMLIEYRESMLNIDQMVVDELKDLFFLLW